MTFANQFLTALYRFGSYPELLKVKGIKTFLYTVVTIVLSLVIMMAALAPAYLSFGGITGFANKYIPDFTIADGKLTMDKMDYTDEEKGVRVYVDTASATLDTDKANENGFTIIANADSAYLSNGVQQELISFKDFTRDFSGAEIRNELSKDSVQLFIILSFALVLLIALTLRALYSVLILTLVGNIINFAVRVPLGYLQMFKLAAYARTLPWLMTLILPFILPFTPNSLVIYAVGAVYMYMALKNIKRQQQAEAVAEAKENMDKQL
jgi:hypothetical protein